MKTAWVALDAILNVPHLVLALLLVILAQVILLTGKILVELSKALAGFSIWLAKGPE